MAFEIKISVIEVDGDNRSFVRQTNKLATVASKEEAELVVGFVADQVKATQPFARPVPVE